MKGDLPQVMVLEYEPLLKCSVWKDYIHRRRSPRALRAELNRAIRSGRYTGVRLITIHVETHHAIIPELS